MTNWAEYDAALRQPTATWTMPLRSGATEVAIAAAVLNRMLDLGRPNSVRVA